MKAILYTIAKGKYGELIRAHDAEKGNPFYCPVCNSELLLRKSGKTSKNSKRPHFAHKILTPNCTPETALHFSFKNLLVKKIEDLIAKKLPLKFTWNCRYCDEHHEGNLLKKIKAVKVEHNLIVCQPDIALIDYSDRVFAVIEVVVTHKPEDAVIKYYKDNNIILIQLNLRSDKDLDQLDLKVSNPDFVSICFNPKCKYCGHYQHRTKITIVDGPCWKCAVTMRVAMIRCGGGISGPSSFSEEEIGFARQKGAIIKLHFSKTQNENYLANTCPKCGAFAGHFYLFQQYMAPAEFGELPSQAYEIGYHCEHCLSAEEVIDR